MASKPANTARRRMLCRTPTNEALALLDAGRARYRPMRDPLLFRAAAFGAVNAGEGGADVAFRRARAPAATCEHATFSKRRTLGEGVPSIAERAGVD